MRVLLACERSAGHIFPAFCFARKLDKEGSEVYFFITSNFLKKYIEEKGFKVAGQSFAHRNIIIESLWRLLEAVYLILKLKPNKVIGFGGRDSFFLILFSSLLFLDTSIYEPNLKAGKANKVLKFFVRKILRGFESKPDKKSTTIGVVLRDNIKRIDKNQARRLLNINAGPVVFCFGGSQGSVFINDIFMRFVSSCKEGFSFIHLTGQDEYFKFIQLYNTIYRDKFVKDFYYDMEVPYSAADLVVCRSGASTLGEISFYGLPSILIPHPQGGAHQKENALYFKERGAAFVCLQSDFSFNDFSRKLKELILDEDLRRRMGS